ncbi:MAG TPA: hypothetical protein ENJ43_00540 [Gammaproteobacteria bacterium]|nr:hypothetical protein [Gammaproteobacteria bacterium]
MHIKKLYSGLVVMVLGCAVWSGAYAASDAEFPKGWESWPVVGSGAIPDNKSPIPDGLPEIVKETVKTYNWIQDGKGSKYNVRVNPAHKDAYIKRHGGYPDGPTAVLELTDIKALLVTEHLLGEPQYGAYSFDGKDISEAHPSLAPKTCTTCHSGYGEACVTGVCSHNK